MQASEPTSRGGITRTLSQLALIVAAILALARLMRTQRALSFARRTAIITGGSRGLGLELARQLADEEARLVLVARNEAELESAARELEARGARVLTLALDVTDEDAPLIAVREAVKKFGTLDLLINNAGQIQVGPLEHMSEGDFEQLLDLHVRAPLRWMRASAPYLKKSKSGRIVNIASFGGLVPVPHMAPYVTSKFGLVGLSDALRTELAKDGVAVTTVCPGTIRTGSHVAARFKGRHKSEYKMFKLAATLMGVSAPHAAKLILDAARHGDPIITFPIPVAAASVLYRVFPNTAALTLALVNRLMPGPTEDDEGDWLVAGAELEEKTADIPGESRADASVVEFNQLNGHAGKNTRGKTRG